MSSIHYLRHLCTVSQSHTDLLTLLPVLRVINVENIRLLPGLHPLHGDPGPLRHTPLQYLTLLDTPHTQDVA